MPTYAAPIRDSLFVLNDVLAIERYANLPGFAGASPDVAAAVLAEGGRFAAEVLAPLNRVGDDEGCSRAADGSVAMPPGFRDAYRRFCEGGWPTLGMPEGYGGQGMPQVLATAISEYLLSANQSFALVPSLTEGAVAALVASASDDLKRTWLPNMVSGRWTGTMNLTEPACGTDLGLIRTRAVPNGDDSYAISGTKIFISSGEHDLAENIVHLVLAKIAGAPDSVKGISMFLVPKRLVGPDGELGERNAVQCGALERKMGLHGNPTCVMNYDGARGWLVGEPEQGLKSMFVMMNAARLGVGVQGLAQAEVAYQNAVAYARERRQGRALDPHRRCGGTADAIIVHPDVRRMLMEVRAFTEGGRALALWGALLSDLARNAPDADARQRADEMVSLLTPVIKAHLTDEGFAATATAQQVFGGHGYIREHGMEQFVRDARIAQIYEGTNGIQALDLVGRKLARDRGRAIGRFIAMVRDEIVAAGNGNPIASELGLALADLEAATRCLGEHRADPVQAAAGAYPYLSLAGHVAMGLMWLRIGEAAAARPDDPFHRSKLVTASFFAKHVLPQTGALRRRVEAGAGTVMALADEAF